MDSRSPSEVIAWAEQQGVDRSILRERLRLTPTERLERHQKLLLVSEPVQCAAQRLTRSRPATAPSEDSAVSMISCWCSATDDEIARLLDDPDSIVEFVEEAVEEGARPNIDLDKAWHGIHYLLTGTAWGGTEPLHYIVTGGQQIGEVDVGYGPARAFTSEQARAFASAIAAVTPDELASRFNPHAMAELEIYPDIWGRDPAEDDTLTYLLDYFEALKEFVELARDEGMGLITFMS